MGKKGRVYSRGGLLWVDFRYLGERVREPSGLENTAANRQHLRKQLDLIVAEIENGVFRFAKRFPQSKRKGFFSQIEGRVFAKQPNEILFGDYERDKWWPEMSAGMSQSQIRDYKSILKVHLLPYFGKRPFSDFGPVLTKKFVAHLHQRKTPRGNPLSPKRMRNILIPLRMIFRDACDEFGWTNLPDPFKGFRLPVNARLRIRPFSPDEWADLMESMNGWYRPYFEFAVQTGLRPSEQVALKWESVDDGFVHIERSRVRGREKTQLKTPESNRSIEIRPSMRKVLEIQKAMTAHLESPYVFVNTQGRPIDQNVLRGVWVVAMKKSGLPFRRMYETRHTFATWALQSGESVGWVARTLGHVDTTMVHRTYGRFIPNLTRQDGSAFEHLLAGPTKKDNPK